MNKNVAVIGAGYWGKNLVRNFYELDALAAICDKDERKLNELKEKYPDVPLHLNHSSLFNDPDIHAVAIATPAASHYSLTKEALLAGKDVFVEKPISLHYEEGAELVDLASSKNISWNTILL